MPYAFIFTCMDANDKSFLQVMGKREQCAVSAHDKVDANISQAVMMKVISRHHLDGMTGMTVKIGAYLLDLG